jgi:hypothetical protein
MALRFVASFRFTLALTPALTLALLAAFALSACAAPPSDSAAQSGAARPIAADAPPAPASDPPASGTAPAAAAPAAAPAAPADPALAGRTKPAPPMSKPLPPQRVADAPPVLDYACRTASDCAVKNVGNCCGQEPRCVNVNSPTDPAAVQAQCAKEGRMSICGFQPIQGCECRAGRCEGVLMEFEAQ